MGSATEPCGKEARKGAQPLRRRPHPPGYRAIAAIGAEATARSAPNLSVGARLTAFAWPPSIPPGSIIPAQRFDCRRFANAGGGWDLVSFWIKALAAQAPPADADNPPDHAINGPTSCDSR